MPDFPLISDVSKATQQVETWWRNATELTLAAGIPKARGQWLRRINLVIHDGKSNTGVDLSMMRINFNVNKMTTSNPNFLTAKIYNLSPETMRKVRQYGKIQVSAGYVNDQYGIIFDGTVIMYIEGKENPTDTYLELFAGDADKHINYSVKLQTWPAKTLPSQKCKDAVEAMGLKPGYMKLPGEQPSVKSSTFVGRAVDLIRGHTNAYLADFFVDDGCANILPWAGYLPGTVVELSPSTGLVGIPKVTPQGIECQCLLNPRLRLGGLIKLERKRLSGIPYQPGSGDKAFFTPGGVQTSTSTAAPQWKFGAADVAPSDKAGWGTYKILLLEHMGDTHGQPWYSQMVCAAADASGKLIRGHSGTAFKRVMGTETVS